MIFFLFRQADRQLFEVEIAMMEDEELDIADVRSISSNNHSHPDLENGAYDGSLPASGQLYRGWHQVGDGSSLTYFHQKLLNATCMFNRFRRSPLLTT